MYKIYFIINNVNKYLYIGSTNDFEKNKAPTYFKNSRGFKFSYMSLQIYKNNIALQQKSPILVTNH